MKGGKKRMKKRILFGSCFATFLLLSIAFITPVQANSSDILTTLDQLSSEISKDEEFLNLLNDPDVEEFINLIIDETGEWDEEFYTIAEEMINIILEKQEFKNLVSRYRSDVELLHQKVSEKNPKEIPDAPEGIYYTITDQAEGLEINKQSNPDIDGEGIVVSSSDDSINIVGIGILNGFFLGLFIKFLNLIITILDFAGKAVKVIYTILSVAAFIVNIFNKPLGASLKAIAAIAATIRTVISITGMVLSTIAGILEIFYKIITAKSRNTNVVKTHFTRLMEKINRFLQRFQLFKEKIFQTSPRPLAI